MTLYSEALAHITDTARTLIQSSRWGDSPLKGGPQSTERVPLAQAHGRICAEELRSLENSPRFDNSAMDGFAVQSSWTQNASEEHPLRLKVVGSVAAGQAIPLASVAESDLAPSPQEGIIAWEIMTGAAFPDGFDACVRLEDTQVKKDNQGHAIEITLTRAVHRHQNRRVAGEDFQIGTPVIRIGQEILPEYVLALATLGFHEITVFRKTRVAVISTGLELVPMNQTPQASQIRNSNAPYLLSALEAMGAEAVHLGTVLDDPAHFRKLMTQALNPVQAQDRFDIILTTGAVSKGKYDFVTQEVKSLGAQILFHQVDIRPGKPILFAQFQEKVAFFGLPGNPVASVVGLRFFVYPFLRILNSQSEEKPMRVPLKNSAKKPSHLRAFYKARLSFDEEGSARVSILEGQLSFMVRPLLQANVWAVLSESSAEWREGSLIDIYPLQASAYDWAPASLSFSNEVNRVGGACT